MRKPGKSPPFGGACERHGLPLIQGEDGCFHCVYGRKKKPLPTPRPAPQMETRPKPEPRADVCQGCGKPVAPRCTWCVDCRPGDRVRDRVRTCTRCGAPVRRLHARICEACGRDRPPRSRAADRARKAERRARGLRRGKYVQWDGKTMTLAEVARHMGVKADAVERRMRKQGMTIEQAVQEARKLG